MLSRVQILFLFAVCFSCGTSGQKEKKEQPNEPDVTEASEKSVEKEKTILFYGNSITAGYQLDMEQAFPALIQEKLDSLDYDYRTINAGLSGETSAGGLARINWVLKTIPDIFFLELGGNDGLRGLPLSETYENLQSIIDAVKKKNPEAKIIVAGMMVPPNLGQDYTSEFQTLFPKLAEANDATYIPFLLEGVAGNPDLNLKDGIHPTPEGHEIVAETVWEYLEPLL